MPATENRTVARFTQCGMTFVEALRLAQLLALLVWLIALAGAAFFSLMAWMGGAPLHAGRRWFRWSLYPGILWLLTVAAGRWLT